LAHSGCKVTKNGHCDRPLAAKKQKKQHFFAPNRLPIQKNVLNLQSLTKKFSTIISTGEVGEWLKPAVC
jgi:hypothetical protein